MSDEQKQTCECPKQKALQRLREQVSRSVIGTGGSSINFRDEISLADAALSAPCSCAELRKKIADDAVTLEYRSAVIETQNERAKRDEAERDSLRAELAAEKERSGRMRGWANCGGPPTGRTCSVDGHEIFGAFFTESADPGSMATCELHGYQSQVDSILARVGALEADKARLDWMDANGGTEPMRAWSMMHARYMWQWMGRRFDTLREAIDAARQPQETGTPKT